MVDAWGKTGEGGSQSPVSGAGGRRAVGDGDVKGVSIAPAAMGWEGRGEAWDVLIGL